MSESKYRGLGQKSLSEKGRVTVSKRLHVDSVVLILASLNWKLDLDIKTNIVVYKFYLQVINTLIGQKLKSSYSLLGKCLNSQYVPIIPIAF